MFFKRERNERGGGGIPQRSEDMLTMCEAPCPFCVVKFTLTGFGAIKTIAPAGSRRVAVGRPARGDYS